MSLLLSIKLTLILRPHIPTLLRRLKRITISLNYRVSRPEMLIHAFLANIKRIRNKFVIKNTYN